MMPSPLPTKTNTPELSRLVTLTKLHQVCQQLRQQVMRDVGLTEDELNYILGATDTLTIPRCVGLEDDPQLGD